MKIIAKVKKAIKMDKRKAFSTAKTLIRQYGIKNLMRAIYNKATGRPLLLNIDSSICSNVVTPSEMKAAGNLILRRQQAELSKEEMISQINGYEMGPLLSVITPLYNSPVKWLRKAVESLQSQVYENWELCAVDDGSKDRRCITLIQEMMQTDSRIRLVCQQQNGGISSASNVSLEMARGEYVVLMDHDDELPADAFFWFVKEINEHPEADFIYSDECKVSTDEKSNREYFDFYLKPDWSPFLLINHMYTGHLTVYRTSLVRQVGGFRSKYDFSQDYDLALRVSDATKNIRHIERVLYFWRAIPASAASGAKEYARISNMSAVLDWYSRHNLKPVMEKRVSSNYGSLRMETNPEVSIIIPSDSFSNLMTCLQGLLCDTSYKNIELIPVTNGQTAAAIQAELQYIEQLNICCYDKVYNYSDKCNCGAAVATGEILIFLNDDVVPYSKDWVERLIEILCYPDVGGVSPLLLHTNETVQYAGMITGTLGFAEAAFYNVPNAAPVSNVFRHVLLRDVSVLSSACVAMYKRVFQEINGFDAVNTPTIHSNADLSFRLIERGYHCAYTPHSILTQVGNHSWENKTEADKADIYCLKRWGKFFEKDPFFTNSMREMFYKDLRFRHEVHSPKQLIGAQRDGSKDILLIVPALTQSGISAELMKIVALTLENGNFPVISAIQDGPLKQDFLEMGVTVIIDDSVRQGHPSFERFARNFDLVIAISAASYDAVSLLRNSLPPVMWWVHEGASALSMMGADLPRKVGENAQVFSALNGMTAALTNAGFGDYPIESLPGV